MMLKRKHLNNKHLNRKIYRSISIIILKMILFKTIINQREKRKMNNSQIFYRIKKAFLLSFIILTSSGITNAQSDSVVLIKANVPTISDAFKINDNPRITDTVIGKLNLTYQVSPKLYPTT